MAADAAGGVPGFLRGELERLGVGVSAEVLGVLGEYLRLLLDENTRQNLTAIRDLEAAWRRHVIDSLTLYDGVVALGEGASVVDVGSGGGAPGMVLAAACPGLRVTLLDSSRKKAGFLERCAGGLGLSGARVVCARAEAAGQDPAHRQRYDAAVCRAIGPLAESLEYTLPLVRVGGRLMAIKGPSVVGELDGAGDALMELGGGEVEVYDAYPEGFGHGSKIVVVEKERATPKRYPRAPGVPRREPL